MTINRANWDARAEVHVNSAGHELDKVADPGWISKVVTFDRSRLGDLSGCDGVHLQCHLGTDTLSLARLGARMTGLDLSSGSIEHTRWIADQASAEVDFVVADVLEAVASPESLEWNHALSEIVMAVIDAGLVLVLRVEHDSVPSEALPGLMVADAQGEYRLEDRPERLPVSFTLVARLH
ncbi:class I SAM-dependent methyltransferase [Arachnia propionica]|uniref:Class I SAM-dependent methyltransferase n=1 Tax=Arachnia propionica TaxID=1750 RepID=A0A3P1TDD6_9ACTN|nr:class I SAM-dependent methyltransferase [Arachnia propionica]